MPSKVQELTRDDASRLSPVAPEADQHKRTQKRAIWLPGVTQSAVRYGDKSQPGAGGLHRHFIHHPRPFASLVALTFGRADWVWGTDVDGRATRRGAG
jgi:hypothetical protein